MTRMKIEPPTTQLSIQKSFLKRKNTSIEKDDSNNIMKKKEKRTNNKQKKVKLIEIKTK